MKAIVLTVTFLGVSMAMQNPLPSSAPFGGLPAGPVGRHDDDSDGHHKLEAQRIKGMNAERQRIMTRDANELLQLAAELQHQAQKADGEMSQAEMFHQADNIERLAHNVKERMKGAR